MAATVFLNINLIEQPVLIQQKLLLEAVTSHIDSVHLYSLILC